MTWHEYARQYHKCYLSYLRGEWTVYLPDGTRESGTWDWCRDKAREQGCEVIL